MNSLYPDKAFYMFDKLLEHPGSLFKISTPQPQKIYDRLDRYQDYTGRAFYFWKNGRGLYRTDIPNIYAPHTGNLVKALQHISFSIHFGMYLFTDVNNALHAPMVMKTIVELANKQSEQKKLLIFAGEDIDIPEQIDCHFTSIRHKIPAAKTTAEVQLAG